MGTTDQAGSDLALDGIDLLDIGVGLFDADRRLLRCNPAFLALRNYPETLCHPGVSLEALLRHNALHGDFGEGDPDRLVAGRLAEIAATEDRTVERETGDGRIISIRYQKTGSGGLMVTYRDRTEERRAEAALRQSEELYALISEAAEEAIYEWDIPANRFYASDRLKALIGRDWGEQGARAWNWDDIVHPDDQDTYGAELKRHLSRAALRWECTYRLQDAGGGWRWVSDHGTSVRDETGAALRMVAAIRDISDQVDREAALTRVQLMAAATIGQVTIE